MARMCGWIPACPVRRWLSAICPTYKGSRNRADKEFLYNLKHDLGKKTNLATAQPERAAQMAQQLMNQIKAVGGYLPKPNLNADPQVKVYDPSNLSDQGDGSDPEADNEMRSEPKKKSSK
jgi:hypothetical protein